MSFRKRNVVLGTPSSAATPIARQHQTLAAGTRPSPLDGRLTTSTGTSSLDHLLAGHAGLPLGTSLLVEETGTTDFGGILLRYYAAEGLVQGHHVHVLGVDDTWRRELPGLGSESKARSSKTDTASDDKMKIAWRYEALSNRGAPTREMSSSGQGTAVFCHNFDLARRLDGSAIQGQFHGSPIVDNLVSSRSHISPFKKFIAEVSANVRDSSPSTVHRIIIPSLLSPTIFPSAYARPTEVLQLLHGLRALLRTFPTRITAMMTLPISLYPRSTGLTRWVELLSDGVLELTPLQHQIQVSRDPSSDAKSQGLLRAHSLPGFHEKGGGLEGSWLREDLSFKLSSSSGLIITSFSLPPVGETEEEPKSRKEEKSKKESLDF
ncbi:Elongator complex protein 4 [Paramyrothecium foliicola]|nr:Elongator complex protein 4 [Paramyrothecium foliicola]